MKPPGPSLDCAWIVSPSLIVAPRLAPPTGGVLPGDPGAPGPFDSFLPKKDPRSNPPVVAACAGPPPKIAPATVAGKPNAGTSVLRIGWIAGFSILAMPPRELIALDSRPISRPPPTCDGSCITCAIGSAIEASPADSFAFWNVSATALFLFSGMTLLPGSSVPVVGLVMIPPSDSLVEDRRGVNCP